MALPVAQAMHEALLDEPTSGLYEPAGHCTKVMLALAAPTLAQKPPTGQSSHAVARKLVVKLPAAHGVHPSVVVFGASLKDPGMHGRHDLGLVPPVEFR